MACELPLLMVSLIESRLEQEHDMESTGSSTTTTLASYAIECSDAAANKALNRTSSTSPEQSSVERRHHPRAGAVRTLEDITYRVLRRYDIIGDVAQ